MIKETYGIPVISIDALVKDNAKELTRLQHPGTSLTDMRYDPAMARFFKIQLESIDRSHGVVLDGYPATQYQAEDLKNQRSSLGMVPLVLQIEVPDDVVQKRIADREGMQRPSRKCSRDSRIIIASSMPSPTISREPRS